MLFGLSWLRCLFDFRTQTRSDVNPVTDRGGAPPRLPQTTTSARPRCMHCSMVFLLQQRKSRRESPICYTSQSRVFDTPGFTPSGSPLPSLVHAQTRHRQRPSERDRPIGGTQTPVRHDRGQPPCLKKPACLADTAPVWVLVRCSWGPPRFTVGQSEMRGDVCKAFLKKCTRL